MRHGGGTWRWCSTAVAPAAGREVRPRRWGGRRREGARRWWSGWRSSMRGCKLTHMARRLGVRGTLTCQRGAGAAGDAGVPLCLRRVGVASGMAWECPEGGGGDGLRAGGVTAAWMVEHGAAAGLREVAEARRAVRRGGRAGVEEWLMELEGAQGGVPCNGADVPR